ncbi:MAG: UDP-N-acetylglucosamine--N-acetylmuramyl-(pentapeptide) pyrophosphoryl-undecaprenol N-acetylglucosamine transferase [Candidatus Omnitrophica bacterium]|nr:UDP-N-acetylglucosamine--N-acetylmuramyl-(pentapeptide) pyrophosphoryl-undecaprenol N-acetylglucosamine transferase [Candidatus Omnitrophota bacterium]
MKTLVFSGTGYGGHLTAALAVRQAVLQARPGLQIVYVAAEPPQRIDRVIQRWRGGARFIPLCRGQGPAIRVCRMGQVLTSGLFEARRILRALSPDAVLGFGGYGSVPAVLAARSLRVPTLVHEQNVELGWANRLLIYFSDVLVTSHDKTRSQLEASRTWSKGPELVCMGMPLEERPYCTRDQARQQLGLKPNAFVLLVLGGSQGAKTLNRIFYDLIGSLSRDLASRLQVIHQTGEEDSLSATRFYAENQIDHRVIAFTHELPLFLKAADLAVARAGAAAVHELRYYATPTLFVPYPHANSHQQENARIAQEEAWAEMHLEGPDTAQTLRKSLSQLIQNPDQVRERCQRAKNISNVGSAKQIAEKVFSLCDDE